MKINKNRPIKRNRKISNKKTKVFNGDYLGEFPYGNLPSSNQLNMVYYCWCGGCNHPDCSCHCYQVEDTGGTAWV